MDDTIKRERARPKKDLNAPNITSSISSEEQEILKELERIFHPERFDATGCRKVHSNPLEYRGRSKTTKFSS